ncbi:MAG: hypothetical protein GVY16_01490 [Planctomycetes bacterium]|jgi:hypothetical protein|nr:hypothetical protein [Phycisphaerae bacterium]NBB94400.1 hypothetical protein [Planctomycetota bacterium]
MYAPHTILGIHITDRIEEAVEVQKLLTANGQQIKTRLGLHEMEKEGGNNGLLLLEMIGPEEGIRELADKLNALDGVECQAMVFHHPE